MGVTTNESVSADLVVPCHVAARLCQEESVVRLFRPVLSGSETPEAQEIENIRNLAETYAVQSKDRVHTPSVTEKEIQARFVSSEIPEKPMPLKDYTARIVPSFVQDSTRVACGKQIGHMTCSLPHYMPPLAELVTAMHQNVVKTETSKTVTLLEKQVMSCLHRLIYKKDDAFYKAALLNTESAMGMFTSGGTIANITGLWVARNGAMGPDPDGDFKGVEECGILGAAMHYGYTGAVIIGSALMHYSMKKAVDLLGIGVQGLVTVDYDENYRVKIDDVERKLEECKNKRICVLAVVGIAGATETGSIDDIEALANLTEKFGTHLHIDAAWGGPCLFSKKLSKQMVGIERADSVTIDGHKQLFMPMGCGMLVLRDPEKCKLVSKTASYIIRAGSSDLGRFTLEGSRPSNAVYMHANLACIGASGYETLMDRSARVCSYMASALRATGAFEPLFEPMTNILLYRFVPEQFRSSVLCKEQDGSASLIDSDWDDIDAANASLQERQKSDGNTFVSRTTVFDFKHRRRLVALRVVIGNPLTEECDIDEVIADQLRIVSGKPREASQRQNSCMDTIEQDQSWQCYWERMPEAAKIFFQNDTARLHESPEAPPMPSALR